MYNQIEGRMASQSQGIQQLLAAEKKAAELVADARKSELFSFLIYMQSGIKGGAYKSGMLGRR